MYKVLYLIDSLQTGGAEKSLVTIASRLKKVQPIFVYVYDGNSLEKNLREFEIPVFALNIKREYNFKDALKRLLPIVEEIKPEIIHSTLYNSDIISRKLKKKFPVILINSFVNNSYTSYRFEKLSWFNRAKLFAFQQYDRMTSSKVDLFISNSEAIKKTNASALKISPEKIKVIHRGREVEMYENIPADELQKIREELNLRNETILLNVGRLLERKGQMDLLIAFKELVQFKREIKLIIAGEGGFESTLRAFIEAHNLEENVLLIGNRKDIPQLLKLAHLFVFPSWYEGLPGSLIEAMMAGVPVIASNIPENLECVDEQSALIFQKGDYVDLRQKMEWALENKTKMLDKSTFSKKVAEEKFDINRIVDEYEKTYLGLIENCNTFSSQSYT